MSTSKHVWKNLNESCFAYLKACVRYNRKLGLESLEDVFIYENLEFSPVKSNTRD